MLEGKQAAAQEQVFKEMVWVFFAPANVVNILIRAPAGCVQYFTGVSRATTSRAGRCWRHKTTRPA